MYRIKNITVNATPQELTIQDEVESHYTIIITNISANKHILVGDSDVSTTHYGFRIEHDTVPFVLENMPWTDRLYAICEDPQSTAKVAVMIIER